MRPVRLDVEEGKGVCHSMSLAVVGRCLFHINDGLPEDAEYLAGLMRRLEAFTGFQVFSYRL